MGDIAKQLTLSVCLIRPCKNDKYDEIIEVEKMISPSLIYKEGPH